MNGRFYERSFFYALRFSMLGAHSKAFLIALAHKVL